MEMDAGCLKEASDLTAADGRLHGTLNERNAVESGVHHVMHYFVDFLLMAKAVSGECLRAIELLKAAMAEQGVPLAQ
ncbi:hypothetical protein NDU88_006717 [Pleurodeles waltl]|uniref:Uncharacterized protein n=1 Tax=Pleurodeles waltl TaxID=8319 RepID=A0AAV7RMD5_PLEWA|nr:hypothetical protein NDU88_006717 [Pleurodeles waltl]